MSYNTKQREIILNYLKEFKNDCITVEEIYNYLKEKNNEVGKVTIYRYLDKLNEEGIINKYIFEKGNKMTYRLIEEKDKCSPHLHMICTKCNKLFHLDCNEIEKHISSEHNFKIDNCKTVIYGLCKKCIEKGE